MNKLLLIFLILHLIDQITLQQFAADPSTSLENITLSAETQREIDQISDPVLQSRVKQAELKAKREKTRANEAESKLFFHYVWCAMDSLRSNLVEAYEDNGIINDAKLLENEPYSKLNLSESRQSLVTALNFTKNREREIKRYYRKWCKYIETNAAGEKGLSQKIRDALLSYHTSKKMATGLGELYADFGAVMAWGYALFSECVREWLPEMIKVYQRNDRRHSFEEIFFQVTPDWLLDDTLIEYFKLLRVEVLGHKWDIEIMPIKNKHNQEVVIPYSKFDCPKFSNFSNDRGS